MSPVAFLALFALMGVSHTQRTYEFTYMLKRLGVHEPFREGFLLTGAGFLLNHLPFNVGLVMRAAVLKRDHALPYASYLALVTVNALINLAIAALLGLASVAFTEPFRPAIRMAARGDVFCVARGGPRRGLPAARQAPFRRRASSGAA